ncbi:MAG: hypothetical protein J6Y25_04510 [Elusimicrobiaceae bacterium]|nr:hypothetical protein [Elusimicrobiaceae bacterium]
MVDYDLVLHQGDDSDFNGQTNRWILPAGDYTGYSARYSVGPVTKTGTISSGTDAGGNTYYYVEMVLDKDDTLAIPPDTYFAALKLIDANSKCATVDTSCVVKILPQEVPNAQQ